MVVPDVRLNIEEQCYSCEAQSDENEARRPPSRSGERYWDCGDYEDACK